MTPALSDDDAVAYVKFLAAGVPAVDAFLFITRDPVTNKPPKVSAGRLQEWIADWNSNAKVAAAWSDHNGGEWADLDDDSRTDVALRHHMAQCAYILFVTDLSDPNCPMKKVEYAKTVITEKLALEKDTADSDKFSKFMASMVANANASLPPVFKAPAPGELPALPATFVTGARK